MAMSPALQALFRSPGSRVLPSCGPAAPTTSSLPERHSVGAETSQLGVAVAASVLAAGAARALPHARRRFRRRFQVRTEATTRHGRPKGSFDYGDLYKPMDPEKEEDEEPAAKKPKRHAARWRQEQADQREDPSQATKWVWDARRRGAKFKIYGKGEAVNRVQEMDDRASLLRARYKRPWFGWSDVARDDKRTARLSEDLPAIGTGEVWLNKFLSHSGACSRRKVAELVLQGRVQINGDVVENVVTKVNPLKDSVFIDGVKQELRTLGEIVWIMMYKPKGTITTLEDSEGRKTVMDLVPFAKDRRLVPIGRIDRNASGLLLLTNDYEWHTILSHPRYEHKKRYKVDLYNGMPSREKLQALRTGLQLPDEPRPLLPLEDFELTAKNKIEEIVTVRFTIKEGRYRQIRRMFEYIGHPVRSIKRVEFGLIKLDRKLRAGEWRTLTPREIRQLKGPTILKRPSKHPFDLAKEGEKMKDQAASEIQAEISADVDLNELSGRDRRAAERELHLKRKGDRTGYRGESASSMEIDEREWDDSDAYGPAQPAMGAASQPMSTTRPSQRRVRNVQKFQAPQQAGGLQDEVEEVGESVRARVAREFNTIRKDQESAPMDKPPVEEERAKEATMEDLMAFQRHFDKMAAGTGGGLPVEQKAQAAEPNRSDDAEVHMQGDTPKEDGIEFSPSRYEAMSSSDVAETVRSSVAAGFGSSWKDRLKGGDTAAQPEAKEASFEDLAALQRRFDRETMDAGDRASQSQDRSPSQQRRGRRGDRATQAQERFPSQQRRGDRATARDRSPSQQRQGRREAPPPAPAVPPHPARGSPEPAESEEDFEALRQRFEALASNSSSRQGTAAAAAGSKDTPPKAEEKDAALEALQQQFDKVSVPSSGPEANGDKDSVRKTEDLQATKSGSTASLNSFLLGSD